MFYNQSNPEYWNCNSTEICREQYAGYLKEAIFASYKNLTGFSFVYEDKDEWDNRPWRYAGIVDYETCMIFTRKLSTAPPNCPANIPDPSEYVLFHP